MTEREHPAVSAQRRAADPEKSVWVAANAGTGKTRVLTERVARLLLTGARPEKILCLTYTKAAAAEMRHRLFTVLGGWAMADEEELLSGLRALTGGEAPDDPDRARRLFAEALETPGGLKIQTIHAFCESLLRRFPLEAGAPPGFQVLDEARERPAMIAEALEAMASGDDEECAALTAISSEMAEDTLSTLAGEIAARPDLFPDPPDEEGICAALGAPFPPSEEGATKLALGRLDHGALERMKAAWGQSTATDKKRLDGFAAGTDPVSMAKALGSALLKADGEPLKKPANAPAQAAEPDWARLCERLTDVALEARDLRLAVKAAQRSLALARFGACFLRRWEAMKRARSLLDYNDLTERARALLTSSEMAAWALYRLDGGVDHILVDEAQDTSAAQWDMIDAIAAEFRAGEGARARLRTSFIVGDEKQSIYSFQGAAPAMFSEMRQRFREGLSRAGGLAEEALEASFRSAPAILRAVDATFQEDRAKGLTAEGAPPRHSAFFDRRAGRVDLWPLIEPEASPEEPEPWKPVDMPGKRTTTARLAAQIADFVAELCRNGRLPGGAPVRPGDIMILLKKRTKLMSPLNSELKARGVPVAGVDRLMLGEALAVKDLLALMRFAVTPEDDLNLAALLRSPLFDVDEAGLFDLAYGRDGMLWTRLREAQERFPREVAVLEQAARDADFLRPYDFLQKALLTPEAEGRDGRRRLIARLGVEAEEPLDELLAQALTYEAGATPSLEGFLGWMASGDVTVKREAEGAGGQLRVLTAHGAKGLQAPVVILPDTMGGETAGKTPPFREMETGGGRRAVRHIAKTEAPAQFTARLEEIKAAEADESRRLLYVAMTRAEDWLIIAGAEPDSDKRKGPPDYSKTWYGLAEAGMKAAGAQLRPAPGGGEMLRLDEEGEARAPGEAPPAPEALSEAEAWAFHPPAIIRAAPPAGRIAASSLGEHEAAGGAGEGRERAMKRGVAIHAALEHMPADLPAFRRILPEEVPPGYFSEAELAGLLAEAERARRAPGAARFFSADAVAEATVSLAHGDDRISGRIDRLVVTQDEVAFVDFKSDAAPPAGPEETPPAYLLQMAAYHEALSGIFPERKVTAHILWTAAARLDQLTTLPPVATAP